MTDEMPELTRAWHPRARVARVRASHSYGLVLALIVVSFVFMSVAPNSTWADSVLLLLQTITLVTALWTSGVARTDSTLSLGLVDQGEANVRAVSGAVCVYVLIGLLFVFLYGAIAKLGSGHFFAQGTDGTRSLRLYFSFVTLATLGYGDYTPAGSLGRTLAIVEALFGQLYLVTVIAVLVSRMRRASPE